MSSKSSAWQHASAAPQYQPEFAPQEGLDNNWVFFPEPHFVHIEDEEDDDQEKQTSGRRDSVGSVDSEGQGRPGMQQRQDSWVGGWWGKIFKSKL